MTWDGKGNRAEDKGQESLRDIVISTREKVSGFVENFNEHKAEDTKSFDSLTKKVEFQQKIVYGALGIIAFFELVFKVVK